MRGLGSRRAFLATMSLSLIAALAAQAQQAGRIVRIGLLDLAASDPAGAARWKAFRERLRELKSVIDFAERPAGDKGKR